MAKTGATCGSLFALEVAEATAGAKYDEGVLVLHPSFALSVVAGLAVG